ncbi:hypothetical protein [Dyadobacter subterraneus]
MEKIEPKSPVLLDSIPATVPVFTAKRPLKPGILFQKVDLGES